MRYWKPLLVIILLLTFPVGSEAASRTFPFHVAYASRIIKPSHISQAQMDNAVRQHYAA